MGHFVTPLIYGALAEAAPDRVQADSGMMNLITFQGRRRDDRAVLLRSISRPAAMARSHGLDGWSTLPHPSNMAVVPVEIWETLTHMTVLSKRLLTDIGGPGQWRGGLGQEVVLRNDTGQPLTMLGMGNRTEFPARGLFGGGAGTLRLHAVDGEPVHAKGRIEVAPGQPITVIEAGGGGFGDPRSAIRAANCRRCCRRPRQRRSRARDLRLGRIVALRRCACGRSQPTWHRRPIETSLHSSSGCANRPP